MNKNISYINRKIKYIIEFFSKMNSYILINNISKLMKEITYNNTDMCKLIAKINFIFRRHKIVNTRVIIYKLMILFKERDMITLI